MSTKVLFLFQDSIQDPTLHLIVISPSFPLFCDYFVIFPCSWIWLFWKVPGQMFWNAPQVCIYLIFYQHFIGDIGFFSLFFFFGKYHRSEVFFLSESIRFWVYSLVVLFFLYQIQGCSFIFMYAFFPPSSLDLLWGSFSNFLWILDSIISILPSL